MSMHIDRSKNSNDLPVTYLINIKTLSTSKRPLTCCITTMPRSSTQQSRNDVKPSICPEETHDFRPKSLEHRQRSSIQLPVTYSTSIHLPCHPRPSTISPIKSSHHHHHHYHYHHHHCCHRHRCQRQLSRSSTSIKHKSSPQPTSVVSTRPDTTSTTTTNTTITTSPNLPSKPNRIANHPSISVSTYDPISKPSVRQVPLPSYSALAWNWFQSIPRKTPPSHKGGQSDYSEVCRRDYPRKRSALLKFLTSPLEKHSKSKQQRTCFTRKRFESSSSLPNKFSHYDE